MGNGLGRAPAVYSMRGCFSLESLVKACGPDIKRVPFAVWRAAAVTKCQEDPAHPLAALLPHIDSACPPLASPGVDLLSMHCRAAASPDLCKCASRATGAEAFLAELARCVARTDCSAAQAVTIGSPGP